MKRIHPHSTSKQPEIGSSPVKRAFSVALAGAIVFGNVLGVNAQILDTAASKPVRGQIALSRDVNVVNTTDKVSLHVRDTSLKDVLYMLSQFGKFNIIVDESVEGSMTVDIDNISVNKALEYIFTVADLSYTKDGNTIIVASRAKADEKNLNARTFKTIPVQYKDANIIAAQLNSTVFKVARPNGSTAAVVAADSDSNSLMIMGTESDIKLVGDALRELDVPRNRKVYHIRYSTPNYVAQVLAANFFQPSILGAAGAGAAAGGAGAAAGGAGAAAGGAGAAGAGGAGAAGAGGAGAAAGGAGAAAGGAGAAAGGAGAAAGGAGAAAGGAGAAAGGAVLAPFTTGGVTFVPEPIASTLTVLGTDEQLALIDSIIDQVDVRRPQASIEVALVEIQTADLRAFIPKWGSFNTGKETGIEFNLRDAQGNLSGINAFIFNRQNITRAVGGNDFLSSLTVTHSNKTTRNKVLANPTVVAMDGTSSTINITDQVPSVSQTSTLDANGNQIITNTITTQAVGITLQMTPRIFNDGSIELNLAPNVTQPGQTFRAGAASTVLVSTRSLTIAGARVKDGQTLVIGGLLRESQTSDIDKIPGIGNMPILKAMFNATNSNNKNKTELVLMVTPHILKEDAVSYFNNTSGSKYKNPNQGGIQPVSLPRFVGPMGDGAQKSGVQQGAGQSLKEVTPAAAPAQKVENPPATQPASSTPTEKIEMDVQPMTDLKKSMRGASKEMMAEMSNVAGVQSEAYRIEPVPSPEENTPKAMNKRKTEKKKTKPVLPETMGEILKN